METNLKELRVVQKMNRASRKAMADSRAMEEQMERENPLSGSGATPSMGLSQVRGGKKMMMNAGAQGKHLMEHLEALHGSGYAEAFHKGMGSGKKHHKQENDSESDMEGGLRTGRYEGEGHCGGMFSRDTQDFSGHMKGGFLGMLASIGIPLLMNLLGKGKMTQDAHDQVKDMIENKLKAHENKHHMKGGNLGMLASIGIPLLMNLLGKGKMTQDAHDKLKKMFMKCEKMEGSGRVVGGMLLPSPAHPPRVPVMQMEGMGKVKRVVGAGDGRRKRADIVKKVMAEKGLSMVQASKYVKEHGLYKKD